MFLSDDGSTLHLAYVHHAPKNPLFESKIKRGWHGRFGNKFKIPNYTATALNVGKAAGGSNGARWATRAPHPNLIPPTEKKTDIFGKGGTAVKHAVSDKWETGFTSSHRGKYTVQYDPKAKEHVLYDDTDLQNPKEISAHASLKEAKATADAHIAKSGASTLPTYKPPKDVDVKEPDGEGVSSVGLLIREPDGRLWIREPSNHFGGYEHSFPKGQIERGESLQQAAHREAYEETGLKANITGFLGDFQGDTSTTRMYVADRAGGEPTTNDETWAMKLVHPDQARKLLNRRRDKNILNTYLPDPKEKWILKHYNGNEDRVATELLSNAIYRSLDIDVPEAGQTQYEGRTALTYPAKEGVLKKFDRKNPSEDVGKGFMADALLANWDVIGLEDDNILWGGEKNDKPIRLDQGGTLAFRAMGSKKPFGPTPEEAWNMLDFGQAKDTMSVTPLQKREQATQIYKTLTPNRIDDLVDQAPFATPEMREEIRDALQARVIWMGQFGKGMINEGEDARQPTYEETLQDDIERNFSLAEMRYFKDKVSQPQKTQKALFERAQAALQTYKFLLNKGAGVEKDLDAHVLDGVSDDQIVDELEANPNDYHVIISPNKSEASATEKVEGKYGGDWSRLTDVVRATIVVPHPSNISTALASLKKHAGDRGWKFSQLDSKLYTDPRRPMDSGPTEAGCRDVSVRLETVDGFQIELQFNWTGMVLAKAKNHPIYEQSRAIERQAGMKPDAAQLKEIKRLNKIQSDAYAAEWEKVYGDPAL